MNKIYETAAFRQQKIACAHSHKKKPLTNRTLLLLSTLSGKIFRPSTESWSPSKIHQAEMKIKGTG